MCTLWLRRAAATASYSNSQHAVKLNSCFAIILFHIFTCFVINRNSALSASGCRPIVEYVCVCVCSGDIESAEHYL